MSFFTPLSHHEPCIAGWRGPVWRLLAAALLLVCGHAVLARDIAVVPLLNGERDGLNSTWGGEFNTLNMNGISLETNIVRSGNASYKADLGNLAPNTLSFLQTFSSERTGNDALRQTRDLTRFERFDGYIRNDSNTSLNIRMELKDYRDSNSHRASKTFTIPNGGTWTPISTSLDLSDGWTVQGSPDLERTYISSFVINQPTAISGSYYFDDFSLIEAGGSIDSQTAGIETIVERLAERHFSGLWYGRNRTTGLIYNHKDDVGIAAMNTTGGTLWLLPKAVERGWVSQTDADTWVAQLANSLDTNLDQTSFVPSRFIHPVTASIAGGGNEESSIDASFIALALHNYKQQPTTSPDLAAQIDAVQNRFQLDAFAVPNGFRLAYFPASSFTANTYNGYTNEGKVISLAAEVSDSHQVPLEDLWNSDTARSRNFLVNPKDSHLTHSLSQFRAPFEQALLNLFIDTSQRGADNYPNRNLATNPWQNFVRYQREVAAKLDELGRKNLFQPDAASGAPFSAYHQYSLYNDQGQPDLFMPWSVAFALLAGTDGAEQALRALLDVDGVMGTLGFADSVRWNTGEAEPYFVSNSGDNWNTVLSTMAMMEWLDRFEGRQSGSEFFASLSEVDTALDEVFLSGDYDGNGVVNGDDYALWQNALNSTAFHAADGNSDGHVSLADYTVWRDHLGAVSLSFASESPSPVPEPTGWALLGTAVFAAPARRVYRDFRLS